MDVQTMKKLGGKLGITSNKLLRRAQELHRLALLRCSSALAMNASCQAVMCLELAAAEQDHPIDKTSAIQLSGVNKKVYTCSFKTFQTLLDMEPKVSIRDLAVQFGCVGAVDHANKVLQSYRKTFEARVAEAAKDDVDFGKPLFTGAALYIICKRQKVRVEKTKLLDVIGTKRSVFDKLCIEMEKHATQILGEPKSSKTSKRHHSWLDDLEKSFEDEVSPPKQSRNGDESNSKQDDYEEWKKRILEGADDSGK